MAEEPKESFRIRYEVEMTLYTESGNESFQPVRIKGMSRYIDYAKHFTPMLTITTMLNTGHVKIIKNNENTMMCKFILYKLKYTNSSDVKDRVVVEKTILYDTVLVPIIETEDVMNLRENEDTVPIPEGEPQQIDEMYSNDLSRNMNLYQVRFYMNTIDYYTMYKRNLNFVLRGGKDSSIITVDTALRFICENINVGGYILDMPDNMLPYENIVIPPGNVKNSIDMLQMLYGVYLKGILSFYDMDNRMYILNRYSKSHEYEEGRIRKCELVIDTNREKTAHGSMIYLDDAVIQHYNYKELEDNSIGIAAGEVFGDSIVFTNFGIGTEAFYFEDGKLASVKPASREFLRNTLSHSKTGVGLSFEYDELNNSFNMFSVLEELGITKTYVVNTEGMDLDCLRPNVIFSIRMNSDKEVDNNRFVDKLFPILSFNQEFVRDNDISSDNVFISYETIMLAELND